MKSLKEISTRERSELRSNIRYILTDIDDTLTTEGQLPPTSYNALWKLSQAGFKIIPVTGRPAGWCEMIARFWPVDAVVGENGGFYFRYDKKNGDSQKKMHRWFFFDEKTQLENQNKLKVIKNEVLQSIPGSAIASDQFCRLMDLAIDFCEDVPRLKQDAILKIVSIFEQHGAQAKVSSIHVNGWFGNYSKVSTAFKLLKNEFHVNDEQALKHCIFVGDSPNDEPMFAKFPITFGVGNIRNFENQMSHLPTYAAQKDGAAGFCEIADVFLN